MAFLDLSFTKFITPSLLKILYIISIALLTLCCLVSLLGFITKGFFYAIAGIIIIPIGWAMGVVIIRVYLELIIVLFKIEHNTRK